MLLLKYPVANKMYEAGKYSKAIRLFEQIAPAYKGKPQAEKVVLYVCTKFVL
jgi:outer membrane protein assembly factor BamD